MGLPLAPSLSDLSDDVISRKLRASLKFYKDLYVIYIFYRIINAYCIWNSSTHVADYMMNQDVMTVPLKNKGEFPNFMDNIFNGVLSVISCGHPVINY